MTSYYSRDKDMTCGEHGTDIDALRSGNGRASAHKHVLTQFISSEC